MHAQASRAVGPGGTEEEDLRQEYEKASQYLDIRKGTVHELSYGQYRASHGAASELGSSESEGGALAGHGSSSPAA